MAKTLFLGGAFFIGRSYQWRKTSLIRNVFCVGAIGLSEARERWRRGLGLQGETRGSDRRALERQIASKKKLRPGREAGPHTRRGITASSRRFCL